MSRTFHHGKQRKSRPLRVRDVRKDPPDARRVARALISLVQAQAEAEAQAEVQAPTTRPKRTTQGPTKHQQPTIKDRHHEPETKA